MSNISNVYVFYVADDLRVCTVDLNIVKTAMDPSEFIKRIPKIVSLLMTLFIRLDKNVLLSFSQELHAHLNGSFTNDTFVALKQLNGDKIDEHFYQILSTDSIDFEEYVRYFIYPAIDLFLKSAFFRCFSKFRYAHELTQTAEAVSLAVEKVIETFNRDNVIYLELRTTPRSFAQSMTCADYLRAVISSIM